MNILINIILDKVVADSVAGNTDLDGSGTTDIGDVNMLINLILSQ